MTFTRHTLTVTRRAIVVASATLSAIVRRLDGALQPPEVEKLPDEDELLERAKRQNRAGRRASRTPWYHHRPGEVQIPDSLKYYEAMHGTKATVEMLKRQEHKLDDE